MDTGLSLEEWSMSSIDFDDDDPRFNPSKLIFLLILLVIVLVLILSSFYTISAGERGVLLTFGKLDETAKGEGLHFKIPMVQTIIKMDIKTQKYEADLSAASRDLQTVSTKIAINYHIVPEMSTDIFQSIGINYAEKVIYPLEQETNKAITSQFTAEQLITNREEVRQKMKDSLAEKLSPRGIIVEEISIINFDFSPSFNQAIEAKVTAEQNALAAKNKLEQVKYEAEQRIAQATAEAEAIRIQAQAITSQGGKDYVQLKAIERWNGIMPQVTGGVMPFVDVGKQINS